MAQRRSSWTAPSVGSGAGEEIYRTLSNALSRSFSNKREQPILDDDESDEKSISKADDWHMMEEVKALAQQTEKDSGKEKRLGVTWTNLTVKGIGADAALHENVLSQFNTPKLIKVCVPPNHLDDSRASSPALGMTHTLSNPSLGVPDKLEDVADNPQKF